LLGGFWDSGRRAGPLALAGTGELGSEFFDVGGQALHLGRSGAGQFRRPFGLGRLFGQLALGAGLHTVEFGAVAGREHLGDLCPGALGRTGGLGPQGSDGFLMCRLGPGQLGPCLLRRPFGLGPAGIRQGQFLLPTRTGFGKLSAVGRHEGFDLASMLAGCRVKRAPQGPRLVFCRCQLGFQRLGPFPGSVRGLGGVTLGRVGS